MATRGVALDLLTRVRNIRWKSGEVIVVFVDRQKAALSTFQPIEGKATLLETFSVATSTEPDVTEARAYKVGKSAGEFIKTTAPSFSGGGFYDQVGHAIYVFVFAVEGNMEDSLTRAKAGTSLAFEFASLEYSEQTGQADPPGLIWSISAQHVPISKMLTWKIRYGEHRKDTSETPPNKMVQCYPLSDPWTTGVTVSVTYTGYSMRIYRLDDKGTGQSYGTSNPDNPNIPLDEVSIDPIWHQEVSSGGNSDAINHGIPFGDPPALIDQDVPNAHDHS